MQAKTLHKFSSRILIGAAAVAALLLTSCSATTENPPEPTTSDVGITMFQWNWNSIASACTDSLGPANISWVLTSPPQEHITGEQWWTSYQPVSYALDSRLGTETEFTAMVETCSQAGVDVIADAVINHMTGQETAGTGTAGNSYTHYEYPGIYTPDDFHDCGTHNNDISVYTDAFQVQNCELVNLADLKTETEKVQQTIADYLTKLLDAGVAGFRIDAAKHMPAADIAGILERVNGDPVIIQEVIRGAGEPIQPEDYLDNGAVFEFSWGKDAKSLKAGSTFSSFLKLGTTSSYVNTEQAYTFVENHDTERNGSTLSYKDPQYEVFTALTLASPYGTPVLYSGYAFTEHDAGAPMDTDTGKIADALCAPRTDATQEYVDGQFTCQQDWPTLRNMISWRTTAGDAPITEQWSEKDGLAFARDGKAFIAVNRSEEPISGTWNTTLPAGKYCDGGASIAWAETCTEPQLEVDDSGVLTGTIPAYGVIALSLDQRK